jgi:hypothetical protein
MSEVVVVALRLNERGGGDNPPPACIRMSKVEGWPPTRVSSEGGAGSGHESPPSPESQVGGWWLAGSD